MQAGATAAGIGYEEFRVPKTAVRVDVLLDGGRLVSGEVHAASEPGTPLGRERVLDLLQADEHFLPITGAEGARLVNKNRIVAVRVAEPQDAGIDEVDEIDVHALIEVRLARVPEERSLLRGTVAIAMPPGRTRVLDYLNGVGPFLPLATGEGMLLVARRYVLEVSPAPRT